MLESRAVYNGVPDDTEVLATEKADHSRPFSSKENPSGSGSSLILVDQSRRTIDEQSSLGSYELVDDFSNGSQEAKHRQSEQSK